MLLIKEMTLRKKSKSRSPKRSVGKKDKFYKTELCKFFQNKGYCARGQNCHFAHGVHELRHPPSFWHLPSNLLKSPERKRSRSRSSGKKSGRSKSPKVLAFSRLSHFKLSPSLVKKLHKTKSPKKNKSKSSKSLSLYSVRSPSKSLEYFDVQSI
jgi:hypothetical protein